MKTPGPRCRANGAQPEQHQRIGGRLGNHRHVAAALRGAHGNTRPGIRKLQRSGIAAGYVAVEVRGQAEAEVRDTVGERREGHREQLQRVVALKRGHFIVGRQQRVRRDAPVARSEGHVPFGVVTAKDGFQDR
jgi:hypothetical protein